MKKSSRSVATLKKECTLCRVIKCNTSHHQRETRQCTWYRWKSYICMRTNLEHVDPVDDLDPPLAAEAASASSRSLRSALRLYTLSSRAFFASSQPSSFLRQSWMVASTSSALSASSAFIFWRHFSSDSSRAALNLASLASTFSR